MVCVWPEWRRGFPREQGEPSRRGMERDASTSTWRPPTGVHAGRRPRARKKRPSASALSQHQQGPRPRSSPSNVGRACGRARWRGADAARTRRSSCVAPRPGHRQQPVALCPRRVDVPLGGRAFECSMIDDFVAAGLAGVSASFSTVSPSDDASKTAYEYHDVALLRSSRPLFPFQLPRPYVLHIV
jgi:hypothetical protein